MIPLHNYRVLLFDMGGTFLFGNDRFGPGEDYYATYLSEGGGGLKPKEVQDLIEHCFCSLTRTYEDPHYFEQFPSLHEWFQGNSSAPSDQIPLLVKTFARHEVGKIPGVHAELLKQLSHSYLLGLVSNIWAPKDVFLAELERARLTEVFKVKVFSSDFGILKPAEALFQIALNEIGSRPQETLFIGDSLRCDIEGAKKAGMDTVWVTDSSQCITSANFKVRTILDLTRQS